MSYRFGKLWHLAIIWAIRKAFQCILQGIRFLLANQTRLSPTSDNDSYLIACFLIKSNFSSSDDYGVSLGDGHSQVGDLSSIHKKNKLSPIRCSLLRQYQTIGDKMLKTWVTEWMSNISLRNASASKKMEWMKWQTVSLCCQSRIVRIVEIWTHYPAGCLQGTFKIWQKGNSWFNFGRVVKTVKRICPTSIKRGDRLVDSSPPASRDIFYCQIFL